ncbi:MAG: ATP-binding protein [Thermodesulfobacteriota bacterium]|nr:ATP-binding protein [Thermodesulfobacteriota bacterium]
MPFAAREIFSGSSIVFRIPARLTDTRLLGLSVHSLFANLGFDKIQTYHLELAIVEAANNIVTHSYQEEEEKYISMKFSTTDDRVTCTFVDSGRFVNFLKDNGLSDICTASIRSLPPSSRGICIICDVMDEVSYRRAGDKNVLTLVKYLS